MNNFGGNYRNINARVFWALRGNCYTANLATYKPLFESLEYCKSFNNLLRYGRMANEVAGAIINKPLNVLRYPLDS